MTPTPIMGCTLRHQGRPILWLFLLLITQSLRSIDAIVDGSSRIGRQLRANGGGNGASSDKNFPTKLYIIRFRALPPVVAYTGSLVGFPSTAPRNGYSAATAATPEDLADDVTARSTGLTGKADVSDDGGAPAGRLDSGAENVRAYAQHLDRMHDTVLAEAGVQPRTHKLYSFRYVTNGVAVRLTLRQAALLKRHPAVGSLMESKFLHARTTFTPSFLGLRDGVWDRRPIPASTPGALQWLAARSARGSARDAQGARTASTEPSQEAGSAERLVGLETVGTELGQRLNGSTSPRGTSSGTGSADRDARSYGVRAGRKRGGKRVDTGLRGENVIIGVIDTGVWPENPAFTGKVLPHYGRIPRRWRGSCTVTKDWPSSACSRKLIGAKAFFKSMQDDVDWSVEYPSARDVHGHGTHTASTAAGNDGRAAVLRGVRFGSESGMAPRARIAVYKVRHWEATGGGLLRDEGGKPRDTGKGKWLVRSLSLSPRYPLHSHQTLWTLKDGGAVSAEADIVAAIEAAVADGVDVLTMSLGGQASLFDVDQLAFLHAAQAGVFVSVPAGNSGAAIEKQYFTCTLDHPAPWYTTVAASSHGRNYSTAVTIGGSTFVGRSLVGGKGTALRAGIVLGSDANRPGASRNAANFCERGSLDPAKVRGKIVVCTRPSTQGSHSARTFNISRAAKAAGAVGVVIANQDPGDSTAAMLHDLPASHVDADARTKLIALVKATASPVASLSPLFIAHSPSPTMAWFSSTGPSTDPYQTFDAPAMGTNLNDVVKPDLTAPGVEIWAGWTQSPFQVTDMGVTDALSVRPGAVTAQMVSGTSMSTPHVAGIAALMKQQHPEWSPFAIKSALQTTAYTVNSASAPIANDDGCVANGHAMGSGHVFPARALDPGLVYDSNMVQMVQFLMAVDPWETKQTTAYTSLPARLRTAIPSYNVNLPNIAVSRLQKQAVVTRVVKNVGSVTATYKATVVRPKGVQVIVSPAELTVAPGQYSKYTVTFLVRRPSNHFKFGSLVWTDGVHTVRSVLAVQPLSR
ncbi:unnamed protein product [Closterium sp. Yama58-4]|nr:unnamed protein product [Closterium sp. Yama58-4]